MARVLLWSKNQETISDGILKSLKQHGPLNIFAGTTSVHKNLGWAAANNCTLKSYKGMIGYSIIRDGKEAEIKEAKFIANQSYVVDSKYVNSERGSVVLWSVSYLNSNENQLQEGVICSYDFLWIALVLSNQSKLTGNSVSGKYKDGVPADDIIARLEHDNRATWKRVQYVKSLTLPNCDFIFCKRHPQPLAADHLYTLSVLSEKEETYTVTCKQCNIHSTPFAIDPKSQELRPINTQTVDNESKYGVVRSNSSYMKWYGNGYSRQLLQDLSVKARDITLTAHETETLQYIWQRIGKERVVMRINETDYVLHPVLSDPKTLLLLSEKGANIQLELEPYDRKAPHAFDHYWKGGDVEITLTEVRSAVDEAIAIRDREETWYPWPGVALILSGAAVLLMELIRQ